MWVIKLILALGGLLSGQGTQALITAVAGTLQTRANDALAQHQSDTGADLSLALSRLQAIESENAIKAQMANGRWGLILILAGLVLFVFPFGLHVWSIVLDSIPLAGHVVGSWKIAALPGQFAAIEHDVIMSLFVTGGAVLAIHRVFR